MHDLGGAHEIHLESLFVFASVAISVELCVALHIYALYRA